MRNRQQIQGFSDGKCAERHVPICPYLQYQLTPELTPDCEGTRLVRCDGDMTYSHWLRFYG